MQLSFNLLLLLGALSCVMVVVALGSITFIELLAAHVAMMDRYKVKSQQVH